MKCAFVSPVEFLSVVQPYSSYHLILVHKVIYERRYREFYRERSKAGDFVILDNGALEKKGHSAPLRDVVAAAMLVKPSVVVFPDHIFDSDGTLNELENAMRSPAVRWLKRVVPEVKFMAVPHGLDEDDWLKCFDTLNELPFGIDELGIPKVTGQLFGARWKALERIRKRVRKPCHLLGVWWQTTLDDIRREASYPFVVGVDTPKPIRLAVHGMGLDRWQEMPRGKDFVDRSQGPVDVELLRRNCAEFAEVCKG